MSVKWTSEQREVIELRNRNILVSAAAGSGKTAVLVERIIARLTEDVPPLDVDRLLIVTYTEAAAAEMKERIRSAIEQKLTDCPGNMHLEQQATLVHSAQITTIHSFCLSVIRDHFHVINIDPSFRVAEDGELKLLKQDVLEELLEECYSYGEQGFLDFTEQFGTGKDDRKIEEIILKMYEYSRSYPQPEKWLDQCGTGCNTDFLVQCALENVKVRTGGIRRVLERGLKICEEPDGPYMYADMLEADLKELEKVEKASDFDMMNDAVCAFKWKRLSAKKDESVSQDSRELVSELRKQAKGLIKSLKEDYFFLPREIWERDMQAAQPSMHILSELVKQFAEKLSEKKRDRNLIDFSDMEQFALSVLTDEKDGRLVPSAVAAEYQEQFDEIMIDEYQDSNLVQETILNSVSRVWRGEHNIFMVGDVKQSIYSFRMSRPELFMEKYHTYSLHDGQCRRIDLHKNFRSRRTVLDCVNYIFRQIMKKEPGEIEYDDSAALYPGAEFPPLPEGMEDSCTSELMILNKKDTGDDDIRSAEARMIAGRIRELVRNGLVSDRKTGGYRKVRYSDIVILTRSIKGWAEIFTTVLGEEGIPAYSVSREGYFETYEVSVLLDYLKILDNERQDLPLAAVLTSPFAGFDSTELADIRIAYPNVPFYEAVKAYADSSPENKDYPGYKTVLKARKFYNQMKDFRARVSCTPIHELLREIIDDTGYGLYITAMPGGAQRAANVEMLVERAASFEGTSYKGLFNFVRYIEQLKKYDVDYGEAGMMDEQADTVRIMSIHKSKGLEFPVVFAAGLGKVFNMQDLKGSVLLHSEWGAGLDLVDLVKRTRIPTFLKKMIREKTALEIIAEEMRVLYVALTRAKEKLIMTGAAEVSDEGRIMVRGDVLRPESAKTCLDWLLPCMLSDEGVPEPDAPADICIYGADDIRPQKAEADAEILAEDVLRKWNPSGSYVPELREHLERQMNYVYPFKDEESMKLKFTVSELKKRAVLREEAGEEMYREPDVVPLIPQFLTEDKEFSGASRGSAYHKVMELLDFAENYGDTEETKKKMLRERIGQMNRQGLLSTEMAECIQADDIVRFLTCKTGERMAKAAENHKLYREQPFVLAVDADAIYEGSSSGEKILVQGIIDVYFEEADGLVVLDYKTDKVKSGQMLADKYRAQLDYYAEALEKLTKKPVKEKIIYSFTLGEEIKV